MLQRAADGAEEGIAPRRKHELKTRQMDRVSEREIIPRTPGAQGSPGIGNCSESAANLAALRCRPRKPHPGKEGLQTIDLLLN